MLSNTIIQTLNGVIYQDRFIKTMKYLSQVTYANQGMILLKIRFQKLLKFIDKSHLYQKDDEYIGRGLDTHLA